MQSINLGQASPSPSPSPNVARNRPRITSLPQNRGPRQARRTPVQATPTPNPLPMGETINLPQQMKGLGGINKPAEGIISINRPDPRPIRPRELAEQTPIAPPMPPPDQQEYPFASMNLPQTVRQVMPPPGMDPGMSFIQPMNYQPVQRELPPGLAELPYFRGPELGPQLSGLPYFPDVMPRNDRPKPIVDGNQLSGIGNGISGNWY